MDKSLVVPEMSDTENRYRLLETVRQYAAERLAEAGEAAAAHRRHRDHFLQLAVVEQERDGWWLEGETWLLRTEADEDNFHTALAWSLEAGENEAAVFLAASMWLHWFFSWRPEGVSWLERALSTSGQVLSPARVEAMFGLYGLLQHVGESDPERRDRLLHEALELAERLPDTELQARGRYILAFAAVSRGDLGLARRLLTEALDGVSGAVAIGWCHYISAALPLPPATQLAVRHLEHALHDSRGGSPRVLTRMFLLPLRPCCATVIGLRRWQRRHCRWRDGGGCRRSWCWYSVERRRR